MEKKPNMSNVDELCLKYVFDELDPSEVMLVEQAMMHDQNLLIEVESLKCTWRKMKSLPERKPPGNLSEAILDQAKDYSSKQQFFGSSWNNPGLLATAAIVLFSLLISTAYLLPSENKTGNRSAEISLRTSAGAVSSLLLQAEGASVEQFRVWNGQGNLVAIDVKWSELQETKPDSVQRQSLMPPAQESHTLILSPSIRDFQLTGY